MQFYAFVRFSRFLLRFSMFLDFQTRRSTKFVVKMVFYCFDSSRNDKKNVRKRGLFLLNGTFLSYNTTSLSLLRNSPKISKSGKNASFSCIRLKSVYFIYRFYRADSRGNNFKKIKHKPKIIFCHKTVSARVSKLICNRFLVLHFQGLLTCQLTL